MTREPMTVHFPKIDPNLRVDQVGSLLRPQKLKEVYTRHGDGRVGDEELRQVQDASVDELIAKQEARGLSIFTDGEYRRLNFQDSFVESVTGFIAKKQTLQFQESRTLGGEILQRWQPDSAKTDPTLQYWRPIVERLRLGPNLPLAEWRYAAALTTKPVKITLIATDRICENFLRQNTNGIYRDANEYLSDVIDIERKIVQQLAEAGCPYVQMDAPSYTAYVDPRSLERMKTSGMDPIAQMERSMAADNAVIAGLDDLVFGIHLCRGNVRSMWHREGGYDAIAERLFNGLQHRRLLLEYDTERAGGFAPLRFVPKNKTVVLGLVSTKVPALETADELKRKIDEASRFIPLEQLALSPQCGFSSNIVGNVISEDDQWRKLELVPNVAADVWGR
jgi:5-methyltetrahydropteroyltriglutamate--homocysteine methyltransferase